MVVMYAKMVLLFLSGIATFGTPGSGAPGSVLMLYGLDINRISCDCIFNLLCSYGNILKVFIGREIVFTSNAAVKF